MTKFKRSALQPYTVITPSTPLDELELFLQDKIFALGPCLPFCSWFSV
jgi:hypothetical protein